VTALAPVIVIGCPKGGIGRTTLAVNLAAMLALAGKSTLLVDLDAKGDASASFGIERAEEGKSAERFGEPWSMIKDSLGAPSPPGLSVWAGGPALTELSAELERLEGGCEGLLHAGLVEARKNYSAIVIDSPSNLGPLACNALGAGDVLLIPISEGPHLESALRDTIQRALECREDYTIFGVRFGAPCTEEPEECPLGLDLLETALCGEPEVFQEAAKRGLPIFEHDPSSRAARCFVELGREVLRRVVNPPPKLTGAGAQSA